MKRISLLIGLMITGSFAALALVSFFWTPFDITQLTITERLQRPALGPHLLGTDHYGRDLLSMVMIGARNSIAVAFVAVGIGAGIGVPLGLAAAARRGGWLDGIISRGNDLIFAFPPLIIAILMTAAFGPAAINAIIAIGIFNIPVFARVTRGGALPIWAREFILSARISGKGAARISFEHILPNLLNMLVVQATIQFSMAVLAEAALSYVGLGTAPPDPSWGRMLADAQTMVILAPHVAIVPGAAIILSVLGLNLMGDGLRDLLDPRLKTERL